MSDIVLGLSEEIFFMSVLSKTTLAESLVNLMSFCNSNDWAPVNSSVEID